MAYDIVNQLRESLMPLINESIAAANWNQDEWLTNHWGFDITDGDLCYSYRLYSQKGTSGESTTKYRPYIPDPVPERVEHRSTPGNYHIRATYRGPTDEVLWSHGGFYKPEEGKSIEEWSKQFITAAKMHAAGINGK